MESFEGKKSINKIKSTLLIAVPVLILIVVILYFTTLSNKSRNYANSSPDIFLTLDNFDVACASENGKSGNIKVDIVLYLETSQDIKLIQSKMPLIRDILHTFLRELRVGDISYLGGTLKFKEELTRRINKIIYPTKVKDVLLKDLEVKNNSL